MATVSTLYGETPANIPNMPLRAVMPLPAGHTYNLSSPNSSPFTIKVGAGATALDTSCQPVRWGPAGEVRVVLLTAMATQSQAAEATKIVTDDASTAGTFAPDADIATLLVSGGTGLVIRITTHNGVYEGKIDINLFNAQITKTTAVCPFRVNMKRTVDESPYDNMGVLHGFITVYSGIAVADIEFLWHVAEWENPVGMLYFQKIEAIVPAGFHLQSKQLSPYWGGGAGAGGTGTVVLIAQPDAESIPEGTSANHCLLSQGGKVFRLSLFKDVSSNIPTWADDWCQNNGLFYVQGVGASVSQFNAFNPATPLTFNGLPVGAISATLVTDLDSTDARDWPVRFAPFRAQRVAGENSDLLGGDTTTSLTSWRNRLYNRDGGGTGGGGILHDGYWAHVQTGDKRVPEMLWEFVEGTTDRWTGFLDFAERPFSMSEFAAANRGKTDLFYKCGPGALGVGHLALKQQQWSDATPNVEIGSDRNWRDKYWHNRATQLPSQDFDETSRWGSIDNQHYPRLFGPVQTLLEISGDPLALLLAEHYASNAIRINPNPDTDSHYYGSASKGAEIGRDEGWTAHVCALVFAFSSPLRRSKGIGFDCLSWGSKYASMLRRAQMRHGAFIAWGNVGNNKEYQNARETKLRPVLVAKLGAVPAGFGSWDDVPFATILANFSEAALQLAELEAEVARVTQLYQEAILLDGAWSVMVTMGADLGFQVTRGLVFGIQIARGEGDAPAAGNEPWYRFAVYAQQTPHLIPVTHDELYDLYSSDYDLVDTGNLTTSHHYKWVLGLASTVVEGNPYLTAVVHAAAGAYDADYETTADDSASLIENGYTLLSSLQRTA